MYCLLSKTPQENVEAMKKIAITIRELAEDVAMQLFGIKWMTLVLGYYVEIRAQLSQWKLDEELLGTVNKENYFELNGFAY